MPSLDVIRTCVENLPIIPLGCGELAVLMAPKRSVEQLRKGVLPRGW
jgi:hypothetical protein